MHDIFRPMSAAAMKEAQVPVRIAFAMAQIAAEKKVAAGKALNLKGRLGESGGDALLQFRGHPLVGVEAEHPIVFCLGNREALLRAEAEPRLLDDPGAKATSDRQRSILTARIDDHDFVYEIKAGQTIFKAGGGVAGN